MVFFNFIHIFPHIFVYSSFLALILMMRMRHFHLEKSWVRCNWLGIVSIVWNFVSCGKWVDWRILSHNWKHDWAVAPSSLPKLSSVRLQHDQHYWYLLDGVQALAEYDWFQCHLIRKILYVENARRFQWMSKLWCIIAFEWFESWNYKLKFFLWKNESRTSSCPRILTSFILMEFRRFPWSWFILLMWCSVRYYRFSNSSVIKLIQDFCDTTSYFEWSRQKNTSKNIRFDSMGWTIWWGKLYVWSIIILDVGRYYHHQWKWQQLIYWYGVIDDCLTGWITEYSWLSCNKKTVNLVTLSREQKQLHVTNAHWKILVQC